MIQKGDQVICNERAVTPFKGWVGRITQLEHGRAYVRFNAMLSAWMGFTEIRHLNAIERLARIEVEREHEGTEGAPIQGR